VLVANRGEIAVRVIRGCHERGIEAVAVHSSADKDALHVRTADAAFEIGPPPSSESYLRAEKLLDVARRAGCDAVLDKPFLAEELVALALRYLPA
jgi:acetyl-CoA carboxylase biotin carboxylase subunit